MNDIFQKIDHNIGKVVLLDILRDMFRELYQMSDEIENLKTGQSLYIRQALTNVAGDLDQKVSELRKTIVNIENNCAIEIPEWASYDVSQRIPAKIKEVLGGK